MAPATIGHATRGLEGKKRKAKAVRKRKPRQSCVILGFSLIFKASRALMSCRLSHAALEALRNKMIAMTARKQTISPTMPYSR
jgi:hypothetical protein